MGNCKSSPAYSPPVPMLLMMFTQCFPEDEVILRKVEIMLECLDDAGRIEVFRILESSAPEETRQLFLEYFADDVSPPDSDPEEAAGTPPASAVIIDSLKKIKWNNDHSLPKEQCYICCEDYSEHDDLKELPCGHLFHAKCIETWLNKNCTCPTCRYELPTNDPYFEVGRKERMELRETAMTS